MTDLDKILKRSRALRWINWGLIVVGLGELGTSLVRFRGGSYDAWSDLEQLSFWLGIAAFLVLSGGGVLVLLVERRKRQKLGLR